MPTELALSQIWFVLRNLTSRGCASRWAQLCALINIIVIIVHNYSRSSVNANTDFKTIAPPRSIARASELKHILYWTPSDWYPFSYLGKGQEIFTKLKCPYINCYLTDDRHMFNGDVTKFDALLFNGRNLRKIDRPQRRSSNQVYIYANMESSTNYPISKGSFDNFFNLTMTYRLDSDIKWPYFTIQRNGTTIGPKINMDWPEMRQKNKPSLSVDLKSKIANKNLAVAWFVSNCNAGKRLEYAQMLQKYLRYFLHEVDIYGACGTKQCPRNQDAECDKMVSRDYYFYLAFENSFALDYVTEKVLRAVTNYAVPIVYGGANYTRFLPPDSYLDATKQEPLQMATTIAKIIKYREQYESKFLWKSFYTYQATQNGPCGLCSVLNNSSMLGKTYDDFSKWWNK